MSTNFASLGIAVESSQAAKAATDLDKLVDSAEGAQKAESALTWSLVNMPISTVAHWSERLNLDQKTIQRLFRKETGMTFGQWRQQARLLLALERIAVGEKIIDVALELGYESPSAFTSMFKKQFGKTPSHFFR